MAEQVTGADCATVIGGDVVIKGEISVEKGLRIDGQIEGAITTKGKVLVGKSGQLRAEVRAGILIVEGKISGNITVMDRVQIDASGQVHGDLTAGKLAVAEGATFVGKINVGPEALKDLGSREASAPAAARQAGVSALIGSGKHASAAAAV